VGFPTEVRIQWHHPKPIPTQTTFAIIPPNQQHHHHQHEQQRSAPPSHTPPPSPLSAPLSPTTTTAMTMVGRRAGELHLVVALQLVRAAGEPREPPRGAPRRLAYVLLRPHRRGPGPPFMLRAGGAGGGGAGALAPNNNGNAGHTLCRSPEPSFVCFMEGGGGGREMCSICTCVWGDATAHVRIVGG